MKTKQAYVMLGGGGERSPDNVYSGITFCEETAALATKNLGYFGSKGTVKPVLTISQDNEIVILGEWGTIGSGETLKVRPVKVLKSGATEQEIKDYQTALKNDERLEKILSNLSSSDVDLLKNYLGLETNEKTEKPLTEPAFVHNHPQK